MKKDNLDPRTLTAFVSLGATVFVLGTAIWLRNPGLFMLAGLAGLVTFTTWPRRGPSDPDPG